MCPRAHSPFRAPDRRTRRGGPHGARRAPRSSSPAVMCGIVGYAGPRDATALLIEGLRRLEYRGYDSAGVAVLREGTIERRRAPGKLRNLEGVLAASPISGHAGIGHTRWATHGRPSEENAHPHTDASGRLVVVH